MNIRTAKATDLPRVNHLLYQVHRVHAEQRPDIFRLGNKKYNDQELLAIFQNENTPVYVAVNEQDEVMGYAFCILEEIKDNASLMDRKSLYIDDLCVDETCRGQHIGKTLYEYVLQKAKEMGCYHVTLNVWCCNESAMKFYEKCGMDSLKIVMEQIL